jgi:hypothetical protein
MLETPVGEETSTAVEKAARAETLSISGTPECSYDSPEGNPGQLTYIFIICTYCLS